MCQIAVRYPERWFPPLEQQLLSYLQTGVLVQHDDFANCCKAYFKDVYATWRSLAAAPATGPKPHQPLGPRLTSHWALAG